MTTCPHCYIPVFPAQRKITTVIGPGGEFEPVSEGRKDDAGKLPLHLLPFDAIEAITEILDFGQRKYAPRNWEKGMAWSRVFRATLSHLWKWWRGVKADEETGKSHLWHAGCCILFLIAYELRDVGIDDRPIDSVSDK
ncbi:MAG: dATP/dGTP diphosphohydrolase domain-containing protein [Parvibaculaceae bacterium]